LLLRDCEVTKIKYFTARVSARSDDPNKPTRQQIYLRALRTLLDLEIIFSRFLSHDMMMPLAQPIAGGPKFAKVIKPAADPAAFHATLASNDSLW
jgi:hypothetical protein